MQSNTLGKKLLDLAGYHPKIRVFLIAKNTNMLSYNEIIKTKEIGIVKSPWSFDLDYYLNNLEKYKK